jgi:hypothetical protein
MHMSPKRVGFLICPAMQALDLVGPMDAFSAVTFADSNGRSKPGYEVLTIGFDAKVVPAESGLLLTPRSSVLREGIRRLYRYPHEGISKPSTRTSRAFRRGPRFCQSRGTASSLALGRWTSRSRTR